MKQFGRFFFAIGSALGLCFVGSATASLLLQQPQAIETKPSQLDVTDLWTTTPVRVDTKKQTFERLASIAPVDPPSRNRNASSVIPQQVAAVDDAPIVYSQAHVSWCNSRYRSYNPDTNTYRSYRGSIRTCVSPHMQEDALAPPQSGLSQAHMDWCAKRYRSYRAEDNTYRSFSGGQRDCLSPFMQNG